eukprot:TRINITY_DN1729_c0_g1_i5.p3 TRINITY_DN1729_c0_g1~~TRINITY_DN1729_c0_g1_i5.p3  ORF type:complete len:141 (-),score=32.52 TRINITY_DN1729_c0_g1_i5:673-1095(-)
MSEEAQTPVLVDMNARERSGEEVEPKIEDSFEKVEAPQGGAESIEAQQIESQGGFEAAAAEPSGFEAEPSGFEAAQPSGFEAAEPSGFEAAQPSGFEAAEPSGFETAQPSGFETAQPSGFETAQPSGFEAAGIYISVDIT